MANIKWLSEDGLSVVWSKIKAEDEKRAEKVHTHSMSDITGLENSLDGFELVTNKETVINESNKTSTDKYTSVKSVVDYVTSYVNSMLSAGVSYEYADSLPTSTSGIKEGTIYLVPTSNNGDSNVCDEYIFINGAFEKIGTTQTDIANYYTKVEVDGLLDDKVDKANYLTTAEIEAICV